MIFLDIYIFFFFLLTYWVGPPSQFSAISEFSSVFLPVRPGTVLATPQAPRMCPPPFERAPPACGTWWGATDCNRRGLVPWSPHFPAAEVGPMHWERQPGPHLPCGPPGRGRMCGKVPGWYLCFQVGAMGAWVSRHGWYRMRRRWQWLWQSHTPPVHSDICEGARWSQQHPRPRYTHDICPQSLTWRTGAQNSRVSPVGEI